MAIGVSDLCERKRLGSAVGMVGPSLYGWQLVALFARKLPVSFRPALVIAADEARSLRVIIGVYTNETRT